MSIVGDVTGHCHIFTSWYADPKWDTTKSKVTGIPSGFWPKVLITESRGTQICYRDHRKAAKP